METKRLRRLVTLVVVTTWMMMMLVGQSNASFSDCYGKCFVVCLIEPSQTLCSCTTQCFKQCIFPMPPPPPNNFANDFHQSKTRDENYGFCRLGCAFSRCSSISTKDKPNTDKVDNCIVSCSKTCTKGYSP